MQMTLQHFNLVTIIMILTSNKPFILTFSTGLTKRSYKQYNYS